MDTYDRKARLYPAAAVLAPATLLALLLFALPQWWTGLVGFLAAGGLHILVVHVVRDLGSRVQPKLWDSWGGPPTTARLRWSSAENEVLHRRRHDDVAAATGITLPTAQEEARDPERAAATYETAVHLLRESTRDHPLVKTEVSNYGYRRNLYACRPAGIALGTLVVVVETVLAVLGWKERLDVPVPLMLVAAGVTLGWIAILVFVVTPDFVRRDAERYSDALIAAASSRRPPSP